MDKQFKFRFAHIIFSIATLVTTIRAFTTDAVDSSNTIWAKVHWVNIKENKVRGDVSYYIYVKEDSTHYHVVAGLAHCFDYYSLVATVQPGQAILLGTRKHSGLLSAGSPEVVGITVNGVNYIDRDCLNDDIHSERIWTPVFDVIALIAGYFVWRRKKPL